MSTLGTILTAIKGAPYWALCLWVVGLGACAAMTLFLWRTRSRPGVGHLTPNERDLCRKIILSRIDGKCPSCGAQPPAESWHFGEHFIRLKMWDRTIGGDNTREHVSVFPVFCPNCSSGQFFNTKILENLPANNT